MSIDWSKYGVSSEKKTGAIDWSKYHEQSPTPEQSSFESQLSEQAQLENQARNNAGTVAQYEAQRAQEQQRMMDTELSDAAQLENQSRNNTALVEANPQAYTPEQEPFLVRSQKAIYNKTLGPLTDAAMRIAGNVVDPFHIARGIAEREGMQTDLEQNPIIGQLSAPDTTAEKVTDVAGQIAGSLAPGGLSYKLVGKPLGKLAVKGIERFPALQKFAASQGVDAITAGGTLARGAGAGLGFGAMREGLEAATGDQQSLGGRAQDIGLDVALGGAGDLALGTIGRAFSRNKGAIPEPAQDVLALPPASRYESVRARAEGNALPTNEAPIYSQGDIHTFGLPEGRNGAEWSRLRSEEQLGLPSNRRYDEAIQRSRQEPGTDPIIASGDIQRLGLPEPSPQMRNFADGEAAVREVNNELSRLDSQREIAIRDQFNYLKQSRDDRGGIQQGQLHRDQYGDVTGRTGRISNNPKWYQDFYSENGKVPSNKDLWELAKKHVDEGYDEGVFQVPSWSKENGFHETRKTLLDVRKHLSDSLNEMYPVTGEAAITQKLSFKPKAPKVQAGATQLNLEEIAQRMQNLNRMKRMQDIRRPEVVSKVAPLRDTVGYRSQMPKVNQPAVEVVPPKQKFAPVEFTSKYAKERAAAAQTERPVQSAAPSTKVQVNSDEFKFTQTVKESQHTAPELVTAMNERPMVGARTSDVLNLKEANKLIEKHGVEGLYSKLMAKHKQFDAAETTAAEKLAKHFSEDNLSKALDLIAKTGKGGREMGQAIQALSMWNKLDVSGALLLGTRQLNKGVKNIAEYKTLTPAQGAPITEAAQRIGSAQETKNLANDVLAIVTNKKAGEVLTDAEKATIKQFQDQVKLIEEKGKGILSKPKGSKADATIKEVSQIKPKERTRDQVVNFLDAKAEKARQRLTASRNIGFAAVNKGNPVLDHAIIMAAHIAKGVVKLSDFTEILVRDFGESIKPHVNEIYTKATNIFRKENGLPTVQELDRVIKNAIKNDRFTPEEAKQFEAWASEIGYMSDEFKREATQDLQLAMKALGESTLGRQLDTVETAGMLLNGVTIERNVLGNIIQYLTMKADKVLTVPIDAILSAISGEQRTMYYRSMNQEKFGKNIQVGAVSGYKGVSPSGTLDSYGIQPDAFSKKNPFKYLQKLLGASLQAGDHAFYNAARGEQLAVFAENLGKAKGMSRAEIKLNIKSLISELDEKSIELSDKAGEYAVYQDDTMLSQASVGLKKGLNYPTDALSRKLVDMGMSKKLSMEGYGLGTIINKFAKTPANLIMRGIDYSPFGFIRAASELAPLFFNKGKFNQFEASRALGRAITGTIGFTGFGFILADAGILTGSSSLDKDMRSIEEKTGQGSYKVNWSALERFITHKFSYEAAKYQEGDQLKEYAWLQPIAISVAMGVNANKAYKDGKATDAAAGWERYGKAVLGGLQSILENPMVQGVSNLVDAGMDLYKRQDLTRLKNIGKSIPARFVPTLLNQARTSTDNNQRETFDKNLLTEMGNLMKNKVPGLSKSLPVSYDSLGNARERIQGGQANTVGQYLTSFFSPAKMTEYQVSPEAKIVLDLMNQSGDQNVLPRISNRYIHISQGKNQKDLRVDLTAEQYSQLQQNVGKMVTSKLAAKAETLSNPAVSTQRKVDLVKGVLTDVGKRAREDIGTKLGYKKKDIKS